MQPSDTLAMLTQPAGRWEVLYDDVNVVGEKHRIADCAAFIAGATAAMNRGEAFGVRLEREPDNPHDAYAVKVMGFWTVVRLFSSRREERHLGYIPQKMAYRLGQDDLIGAPIGASLRAIQHLDGEPNIVINVLEPA